MATIVNIVNIRLRDYYRSKSRVYILPNALGRYFLGVWLITLFLSMGYSSNFLLIMSLVLFILNFWWMLQAHLDCKAIEMRSVEVEDNYSGESFKIYFLTNGMVPKDAFGYLYKADKKVTFSSGLIDSRLKRGFYEFEGLCLKGEGGFGFYQTWKFIKFPIKFYVYPQLLYKNSVDDDQTLLTANNDYDQFEPLTVNFRTQDVDWKRYFKNEILVKRINSTNFEENQRLIDLDQIKTEKDLNTNATLIKYYSEMKLGFNIRYGREDLFVTPKDDYIKWLRILATWEIQT